MEKRYNLRSRRRECHIPLELQLAGDEEFLVGFLRSPSRAGQVFVTDNSDTSSSDIDISALLASDKNCSPKNSSSHIYARSDDLGQGSGGTGGSKHSNSVSQNDINHII